MPSTRKSQRASHISRISDSRFQVLFLASCDGLPGAVGLVEDHLGPKEEPPMRPTVPTAVVATPILEK